MIENRDTGGRFRVRFNRHGRPLLQGGQEGIAFALNYGIDIMRSMGRSGPDQGRSSANMFLSKIFRETVAGVTMRL